MMDIPTFILGAIALLATPGPTNTLLATAGATRGIRSSLPLLLAEAGGYVLSIMLLQTLVGPLMAAEPIFAQTLSAVVCVYLIQLSWKLWRSSSLPAARTPQISFGSVFTTTLLNPKAIVFAFTLLPASAPAGALMHWLAALVVLIALCGSAWICLGAALNRRADNGPRVGYRAGAVVLLSLAMLIGIRAAGIT